MAQHDENVVWHAHPVTQQQREQHHGHRGVVLWFTGLRGRVNPPSPGRWRRPCMSAASAPICWTAITCAMACAATRDSAMRIAKRTFAASGKWRADGRCRAGGIDGIYIPHRAERQMVRERLGKDALSKCSSIPRWPSARRGIRKDCIRKRGQGNYAISPV